MIAMLASLIQGSSPIPFIWGCEASAYSFVPADYRCKEVLLYAGTPGYQGYSPGEELRIPRPPREISKDSGANPSEVSGYEIRRPSRSVYSKYVKNK